MKIQFALLGAVAALGLTGLTTLAASAQNYGRQDDRRQQDAGQQRDPANYYSPNDQTGFYDRSGTYRRWQDDRQGRNDRNDRNVQGGAYYQQGAYEQNCRRGNAAAGTIFGALAGGLIGSAVSHGNGGAVVGGAVLGGLLGNTVSKDIDCDDQPTAFATYSTGLNGDVGRRYDWNHGQSRGYFQPTREYRRSGVVCRDFTETTYRGGRELTHSGTACRANDGQWRFD